MQAAQLKVAIRRSISQSSTTEDDEVAFQKVQQVIFSRHAVLWIGFLVPQFLLLGPALFGFKVLSPCDLLALPDFYLPETQESSVSPSNTALTDLVLIYPMAREFAAAEFREGRLPLWQPYNFCGTPFVWPKYSPFELLYSTFPVPVTLAWMQLAQSICIGIGTWIFARRCLKFEFWPAAIVSWCVPWIGFLTLWQGYPLTAPVCFLPWLLYAIDRCVAEPWSNSAIGVAILSAIVLISGAIDVAGLVLLTSGLRFLWSLTTVHLCRKEYKKASQSLAIVCIAWLAGILLACPHLLPIIEFAGTGIRMDARAAGSEERPPIGLKAARNLILPEFDGGSRRGSVYIGDAGNLLESSAGGYAGMLLSCWLIPLSFGNRQRRMECLFWAALAVVASGWSLNLPGIVHLQRLPVLNMLSHNRWVFATAFSFLMLGAIGLEELQRGKLQFRGWFLLPIVATSILALWCLWRTSSLPEPIGSQLSSLIREGRLPQTRISDVAEIQRSFSNSYLIGAVFAIAAVFAWFVGIHGKVNRSIMLSVTAVLLVGELLLFASLQVRTSDPAFYYPRVAALEQISRSPSGRILGLMCLPPNLNQTHGLRDIRGYDAVDTRLIIKLLDAVRDPTVPSPKYASTQWLVPQLVQDSRGRIRLPPILSMLNTRYIVMRSEPSVDWPVIFHDADYWVIENPDTIPRVFIPKTFAQVFSDEAALREMTSVSFDPTQIAYVHSELAGTISSSVEGEAHIVRETPGEISIKATMKTAGLIAVSDLWDADWKAYVNESPAEVLRTNVAIRSVLLPAGEHEVILRYEPLALRRGGYFATGAAFALFLYWIVTYYWRLRGFRAAVSPLTRG